MPGVAENFVHLRERRDKSQIALSLLLDFGKAHRRVKILEDEQGLQGCRIEPGKIWTNLCGTYGMASAAYWFSRVSSGLIRLCHGLLGPRWPIEALLFADDLECTAANKLEREGIVLLVFLLSVLGSPLKLSKFRGGFQVEWIGLVIDNRLYALGLSLHRSNWIINWAEKVIGEKTVETHSFAGGVGRLKFSANAILHLKPWMGPLYAWSSTIQLTGKQVATTPWGIKLILLWVSKQLAKDLRLQITPTLP